MKELGEFCNCRLADSLVYTPHQTGKKRERREGEGGGGREGQQGFPAANGLYYTYSRTRRDSTFCLRPQRHTVQYSAVQWNSDICSNSS